MVDGDYGRRCQLCGNSFSKTDGELQGFVVHIVHPNEDNRANNFGDLIGVCGWHYALMKFGQWGFDFPVTGRSNGESPRIDSWQRLRGDIVSAQEDQDESGNPFVAIPICFFNVFDEWEPKPKTIKTEIRYSIPHWKHLRELLTI